MEKDKHVLRLVTLFWIIVHPLNLFAQHSQRAINPLFTLPKHYISYKTTVAPIIDGNIEELSWKNALWTDAFVDIEGSRQTIPPFETKVKMIWDDSCLYIAADLKEPDIWATLQRHDQIIYHDNDFEVFIDPENNGHDYYEIEVNAFNTVLDLFLPKPYRVGGQALLHWDLHHLRSAVMVNGTINNPHDQDKGWTVEMAIPFRSVSMGNHAKIPDENTVWRINFSRVQWDVDVVGGKYRKQKDEKGNFLPEHNWVWSPQGLINMHYPERWGYLYFAEAASENPSAYSRLLQEEKQRQLLWLVYYKQKEYYQKEGEYASTIEALGISKSSPTYLGLEMDQLSGLTIEAGSYQFIAIIVGPDKTAWSINHEGLVRQVRF